MVSSTYLLYMKQDWVVVNYWNGSLMGGLGEWRSTTISSIFVEVNWSIRVLVFPEKDNQGSPFQHRRTPGSSKQTFEIPGFFQAHKIPHELTILFSNGPKWTHFLGSVEPSQLLQAAKSGASALLVVNWEELFCFFGFVMGPGFVWKRGAVYGHFF